MASRLAENLGTLILAFILAVLVWVVALNEENPIEERTLAQPVSVELSGRPEGMILLGDVITRTQVTIRAPRLAWERLGPEDVRVTASLAGLPPGTHRIDLEASVNAATARIIRLEPSSITVSLESSDTREVPVDVEINGAPALGYEIEQPTLSASHVHVSGPASAVARVSRVEARISVDALRRDFNSSVGLVPVDADGSLVQGVTVTPDTLQLRVPITQKQGFREVAVKVVITGQVSSGYQLTNIQVSPNNITVSSSDPRLVEQMPGFVETQPLDLTGASDDIVRRLPLQLPAGVTVQSEDPTVLVQAFIAAIEYTLTVDRVVEFRGLSPGLAAAASPDTVAVLIFGPLPVLDDLTLEDVRVVADLTGLGLGTYQVTPSVALLPDNLRAEILPPSRVEVIISVSTPTPTADERTLIALNTPSPTSGTLPAGTARSATATATLPVSATPPTASAPPASVTPPVSVTPRATATPTP